MRRLITMVAVATLALGLLAAPAVAKPKWAGPPSDATIVESAIALSGPLDDEGNVVFDEDDDFDILVAAVLATGVNESVLNGSDDYTVFAPTDSAFIALAQVFDATVATEADAFATIAGLGVDTVAAVLSYHVTEGVRNSKSVTSAKSVTMLDGNLISARDGFVDGIGSDADFVDTDIRVADGMIHVIDTVLLPF